MKKATVLQSNPWLIGAAILSIIGALLHIAIIFGGPDWYRAFGAGEPFARAAARGSPIPALITLGIATVLLVWSAYAFSAAAVLPRMPLLPWALLAIIAVLAVRGGIIVAPGAWRPDLSAAFKFWSSLYVLAMAACFAIGTWQRWHNIWTRT